MRTVESLDHAASPAPDICLHPFLEISSANGYLHPKHVTTIESGTVFIARDHTIQSEFELDEEDARELQALCTDVFFDTSISPYYGVDGKSGNEYTDIRFAGKRIRTYGEDSLPSPLVRVLNFGKRLLPAFTRSSEAA